MHILSPLVNDPVLRSLPVVIIAELLRSNEQANLVEREREVARIVRRVDEDVRSRQSMEVRCMGRSQMRQQLFGCCVCSRMLPCSCPVLVLLQGAAEDQLMPFNVAPLVPPALPPAPPALRIEVHATSFESRGSCGQQYIYPNHALPPDLVSNMCVLRPCMLAGGEHGRWLP
jgi:hypothetical protein